MASRFAYGLFGFWGDWISIVFVPYECVRVHQIALAELVVRKALAYHDLGKGIPLIGVFSRMPATMATVLAICHINNSSMLKFK